eukprot:TRINITY_DN1251_c0_g2_i2.p1 TRINITY_DN1251_c0_g2~~TRINITY_DN1251_c0_g2_i2.p1  ORF type:complete len:239 (-),score=36.20 TRINITY_DN1251_c0_g2_i2:355-1071(-)
MPFIRGLNLFLANNPDHENPSWYSYFRGYVTTYRGSRMTEEQFALFKVGQFLRSPLYVASSTQLWKAKEFCSNARVLIVYSIPYGCLNAHGIGKYSRFPSESEWLFPPYTAFKVDKIDTMQKTIYVTVLDNLFVEQQEKQNAILQWHGKMVDSCEILLMNGLRINLGPFGEANLPQLMVNAIREQERIIESLYKDWEKFLEQGVRLFSTSIPLSLTEIEGGNVVVQFTNRTRLIICKR